MSGLSFKEKKIKLKRLLALCTDGQQLKFKKIYSNFLEKTPSEADINLIIDNMSVREIDQGLRQTQTTICNNLKA
jgi:hypothetical protein